jgi:N-methylhydantoinase A
MGLLTTDFKYDAVQTEFQVSGAVNLKKLNRSLAEMQASLAAQFDADHIPRAEVSFSRAGDFRYVGQGYELRVLLPAGEITEETLPQAWTAFHAAHAAEYGQAFEASPIEIVNVRVSSVGRVPKLRAMKTPKAGSLEKAKIRVNPCLFRVGGKLESFETPFYRRTELPVEEPFPGPAVILQTDSTTLVPPGATARVDRTGNIIIKLGASQ